MRRVDLDIFFSFFFLPSPLSKRSAKLWESTSRLPSLGRMEMITGVPFHKNFDAISTVEKKRFNNPAQMDVRRIIEHPRIRVPPRVPETTNFIACSRIFIRNVVARREEGGGEGGKISRLSFRFSRCKGETLYTNNRCAGN